MGFFLLLKEDNDSQTLSNENNSNKTSKTTLAAAFLQKVDFEFNVWTRQDCEDSHVGPNANRLLILLVFALYFPFAGFNLRNL